MTDRFLGSLGSWEVALVGPYAVVCAVGLLLSGLCFPCGHTVATYPSTTGWIRNMAQVGLGAGLLALPPLLLLFVYAWCVAHGVKPAGNLLVMLATAALAVNRCVLVRVWNEFVFDPPLRSPADPLC